MLEQSPGNFGSARVPYDWYQTQTHVIITVRITNLKENDVKVTIIDDALDVMCQLLDGRQFRMHFNLYKTVLVPDSNWAVDTSKLLINLRKADRKRWHSLEMVPDKSGHRPKSFIGIVALHDAKNELNNLLSAAEFESKENSTNAITITQTATGGAAVPTEPISLDYNWYQDDKFINIVIHVPNIRMADDRSFLFYEDDINIILTDNSLNWICNLPTGVTNVTFKLYKDINSSESRYEISPCRSKIEIKLRKLTDGCWPSFVVQNDHQQQQHQHQQSESELEPAELGSPKRPKLAEQEEKEGDGDVDEEQQQQQQQQQQEEEEEQADEAQQAAAETTTTTTAAPEQPEPQQSAAPIAENGQPPEEA